MNREPRAHVYIRPELLSFDGQSLHLIGDRSVDLSPADRAVIDCVLRGESELGTLCRALVELELGGSAEAVEEGLRTIFSDPRSVLELKPPRYVGRPEIIVCDFDAERTLPIEGRELVRRLREHRRVLFLGIKEKVKSSSPDSFWYERRVPSGAQPSWFEFAQWARSIIRFHQDAVLVLLGHRDAVLFGDLAASLRSVVVLDRGWPSNTGVADLRGRDWLPSDLIENLRSLYYTLRFSPYEDLTQLNRNASTTLAGMEAYAVRHADLVCYALADQLAEFVDMGRTAEESIPACLPASRVKSAPESDRTELLLIADIECGLEPLKPFFQLLASVPPADRPFHQMSLLSGQDRFEIQESKTGISIDSSKATLVDAPCSVAFIFPGLVRDMVMAVRWMTSITPVQLVPSAHPHPLQVDADEILVLPRATVESVYGRVRELLDPSTDLRRRVLDAQARVARRWSVLRAIEGCATRTAATPR